LVQSSKFYLRGLKLDYQVALLILSGVDLCKGFRRWFEDCWLEACYLSLVYLSRAWSVLY